jgi:dTMP kinase
MTKRGLFVVLDGVDGCGKSTQAKRLVDALTARGRVVLHVREPGSTALGEALRALLLQGREEFDATTEVLLFAAARRHLLVQVIEPALQAGNDVVCERFHASTFAYQGAAGGFGDVRALGFLREFADVNAPDLEVVLDVDPARAAARRGGDRDRIERRGAAYQTRVAAAYRDYVLHVRNARLVDANASADDVAKKVLLEVDRVRR